MATARLMLARWRRRGAALWQLDGASSRWLEALRLVAAPRARRAVAASKTLKR